MCGIAGMASADRTVLDEALLRAMCAVMRHRGPDDEGAHVAAGAGLAMRRLSVIDVHGGRQPISNEDGTVWVVLNGEIYNFSLLRQELEQRGHRFGTRTDTEVLVHAYEQYGLDFLRRVQGMFALAIWDSAAERLILARDRLGKKPLYYTVLPNRLAFASEVKCLLQVPGVPAAVDPESFADYLAFRFVPAPATMLMGIRQLLPGECAIYQRGTLTLEPYWRLTFQPGAVALPRAERDELFLQTLREAVRARLISDVPLGAFLSGGLDSASVVALMAEASPQPVKTFSIGFEDPRFDERPFARAVAHSLGTAHEDFVVEPTHVEDVLPLLAWHLDDPMADPSALPSFYLAKMTRHSVTVALTGDGGDELLAGYTRYAGERLSGWYRRMLGPLAGIASTGISALAGGLPGGARISARRLARLTHEATLDPLHRYFGKMTYTSPVWRAQLLGGTTDAHALATLRGHLDDANAAALDPLSFISWLDTVFTLPNDMLPKVDRMTMAHGLEARSPFLDHRLVELAAHLPIQDKLDGLTSKAILRRVMRSRLPSLILQRPKKGFNVPLRSWLRGDLDGFARTLLLDAHSDVGAYTDRRAVERLVREHVAGNADHSEQLWTLMFFEVWHRLFVSGRISHPTPAPVTADASAPRHDAQMAPAAVEAPAR